MHSEKRYLFQGHAVAAAARFHRFKDQPLQLDNCLKNVSAALPACGGCLKADSGRQEIKRGEEVLFAFESAAASVTGDYLDRHAAFVQTMHEHREDELGVSISCEATLKNLNVLNRFFVAHLLSQLTAEDARKGTQVRFFANNAPFIEGVVLDQKPLRVAIDREDILLKLATKHEIVKEHEKSEAFRKECERRHFVSHEKYIVTSVVKNLAFPEGLPEGVTVVGHNAIKVENFGKIFFGELVIGDTTRRLTLLRFQLGSDTGGTACCGESKPNGETT